MKEVSSLEEDRDQQRRGVVEHLSRRRGSGGCRPRPRSARGSARRPRPRSSGSPDAASYQPPAAASPSTIAGGPRQLEHAGGGQRVLDLHLEAGAGRAVGADLAGAHDDHEVLGAGVDARPVHRRLRGAPAGGVGERRDGVGRRPRRRRSRPRPASRAWRARAARSRSASPRPPVRSATTGAGRGLLAASGGAELEQLGGHLVGRPGADAGGLDGADQRVVAAHQAGAADPADDGVGQRDAVGPVGLGVPACTKASSAALASP